MRRFGFIAVKLNYLLRGSLGNQRGIFQWYYSNLQKDSDRQRIAQKVRKTDAVMQNKRIMMYYLKE